MFRFCVMTLLLALALGGPIPNNPINATIFNIESFFEQSLGNIAGSLLSHHKANSTEHFQSSDGSLQADVEPINLSLLQGIAFHPSNHQLIAEQATTLVNNATEEVDLIKVDLAPETSTNSTTQPEVATTSSNDTLKSIPSTVVSGTTTTAKEEITTTTSSSSTTTRTTTSAPTTKSVPVVIVTAVTESPTTAAVGNVTTEATKPSSTTDDVSVKIKEVEAEPVILSSGV